MPVDAKTRALQVLETLYPDPTVRAARQEELGETGLMTLGNNVLRQDEFSRSMNEVAGQRTALTTAEQAAKDLYEQNKAWFEQKQADLQELDRLRAQVAGGGGGNPNPNPNPNPDPKVVTAESLAQTLAATEQGAVAFMDELTDLKLQHFQQFGEVLDTKRLLTDKRVQQLGLRGVYSEVHKAQLAERDEKIRKDAEEKIRADERQKVLQAQASTHHPYPTRGNEPSTLDRFEQPAGQAPAVRTVDEMAAEYARLSAARTGAPA